MIRRGVRRLFRLPPADDERVAEEVDAEIDLHLTLREEQLVREGLSREAARAEALRRFGPSGRTRRELHRVARRKEERMRFRERLDWVRQDVAYAARGIVRERALSIAIVVTLALGIGANAAMFGVLDRLLLSGPAHVQDADRLARLYVTSRSSLSGEYTSAIVGYVLYATVRDRASAFDGVAAYREPGDRLLRTGEDAEEVPVAAATWDLFPLLGVRPLLGRFFSQDEDRPPDGERVAVLGHGLWRTRFGADPDVLGRTIELGDDTHTIVGVAPPGFTGAQFERVDVWTPMAAGSQPRSDWPTTWNARWLHVIGRLAPGATPERAGPELTALYRSAYDGGSAAAAEARVSVAPLHFAGDGREPLETRISRWLFAVALILLLIACANVASLHLARGARRAGEAALRLALGIHRGRLVAHLLMRSLLLALAGGAAALLVAHSGGRVLQRLLAPSVHWSGSPVDGRVFAFTLAVTLAAGALTGLLPGLSVLRRDSAGVLQRTMREGASRRSRSLGALAVTQAAAATVLLIAAGLLLRSLSNVVSIPLGVRPDGVVGVTVARLSRDAREAFYREGAVRVRAHPGVEAAALAIGTPFRSGFGVSLRVPGWDSIPEMPGGRSISAVTSDYFRTVGTRLVAGRTFTEGDRAGSEPVTIVNETMAGALWPGEDPLGRCIHIGSGDPPCARVVGVVEDAKRHSLHDERALQYFVPFGQERQIGGTNLLVRVRGDAAAAFPGLRSALEELAGPGAFLRISAMREWIEPEIRPWRAGATLASLFGALALAVTAFGLFSVIAFVVAQRTHEVGVRMVLGARGRQIGGMMLRQGIALVLGGIALGLVLVTILGRFLEPALFQVRALDPLVLTAAAALVVAITASAALLPAVRAARVDPVIALRAE